MIMKEKGMKSKHTTNPVAVNYNSSLFCRKGVQTFATRLNGYISIMLHFIRFLHT